MLFTKKQNLIGQLLLLLATIAWGSSFAILKQTIRDVPACFVIGLRFVSASLVLFIIFYKKIIKVSKEAFKRGVLLGLVVAIAYYVQTMGLKFTTPGRNAFLTALYCVITPFLLWVLYKKKPKSYNIISAVLCLLGIGLISLSGTEETGDLVMLGNFLTVVSAVFYSLQIICIDNCHKNGDDNMVMLFIELAVVGIVLMLLSLTTELPTLGISAFKLNGEQLLKIGYLTLVCTLFAQMAQILGMKYTTPNQTALILSLEAVFGALFSVMLGEEVFSIMLVCGFAVVFLSMMFTEFEIDPLKLLKRKNKEND